METKIEGKFMRSLWMKCAVVIGIIMISIPVNAWWDSSLTLMEPPAGKTIEDPVLAPLSRGSSRYPKQLSSIECWFLCRQVDQVDPEDTQTILTCFYRYEGNPREMGWRDHHILNSVDYPIETGHCLSSKYEPLGLGGSVPCVYVSRICENSEGASVIKVNKVKVDAHGNYSDDEEWQWNHHDEFQIVNVDSCIIGDSLRVCWEERSGNVSNIYFADLDENREEDSEGNYRYTYTQRDAVLIATEQSESCEVEPKIIGFEIGGKRRSIVCWKYRWLPPHPAPFFISLRASGFETDSADIYYDLGTISVNHLEPNNIHQNHNIVFSDSAPLRGSAIITFEGYDSISGTIHEIFAAPVSFENLPGGTELCLDSLLYRSIYIGTASMQIATAVDNGFCRPTSISLDTGSDRLVYCDNANCRTGWIKERWEESGCWLSELEVPKYIYDESTHGQISRYREGQTESIWEVERQLWSAAYIPVTKLIRFTSFNSELESVRVESIRVAAEGETVSDLFMKSDSFSTVYLVYVVKNGSDAKVVWNVDGLLLDSENNIDRLDYPYDVSVIPPQWTALPWATSTPTPVNTPPSPTPRIPGYWVADMHGNRVVRLGYSGRVISQTHVEYPETTPVWSPLEACDMIAPCAVSSAYDGSCWAIDWGRSSVVKVNADGSIAARSTPSPLLHRESIRHPLTLDCAGDPNTCFVADYEGDTIYKVILGSHEFSLIKSAATYNRPFALSVQKTYDPVTHDLYEYIWVSDHVNLNTPPPSGTWTPLPTYTPVPPTALPGQPTYTPLPTQIPTPYPEKNRITWNRFGFTFFDKIISSAVPVGLSSIGDTANYKCWAADRDANLKWKNEIKLIEPNAMTRIQGTEEHRLCRPVDVQAVE